MTKEQLIKFDDTYYISETIAGEHQILRKSDNRIATFDEIRDFIYQTTKEAVEEERKRIIKEYEAYPYKSPELDSFIINLINKNK